MEDVVVTSLPAHWDGEDHNRSSIEAGIKTRLEKLWQRISYKRRLNETKVAFEETNIDSQDVVEEVLQACLEFHPQVKVQENGRERDYGFLEAFEREISSVVGYLYPCKSLSVACSGGFNINHSFEQGRRVTRFWGNYRKSLQESNIYDISKHANLLETTYLGFIDDVLDEIAMINRVHEDQNRIILQNNVERNQYGLGNASLQDLQEGKKTPSLDQEGLVPEQDGLNATDEPAEMHKTKPGTPVETLKIADRSPTHEKSVRRENNSTRSLLSSHKITRLKRLEEDARRVRKSVSLLESVSRPA